jgi:hypothetical protein
MKTINCVAEFLPDGQMALPPDAVRQMTVKPHSKVRIIIFGETRKGDLNRFCGKWQNKRDADEIIAEIYADRLANIRSESVEL